MRSIIGSICFAGVLACGSSETGADVEDQGALRGGGGGGGGKTSVTLRDLSVTVTSDDGTPLPSVGFGMQVEFFSSDALGRAHPETALSTELETDSHGVVRVAGREYRSEGSAEKDTGLVSLGVREPVLVSDSMGGPKRLKGKPAIRVPGFDNCPLDQRTYATIRRTTSDEPCILNANAPGSGLQRMVDALPTELACTASAVKPGEKVAAALERWKDDCTFAISNGR